MNGITVNLKCQLQMPNSDKFYQHIRENAAYAKSTLQFESHLGQSVVICGAGPSLAEYADRLPLVDEVWACNSALPYLYDRGIRVTHGFGIDQGEGMLAEHEFGRALPVSYYLASSVHPRLVQYLVARQRKVSFFHSFLGLPDPEGWTPPESWQPDPSLERTYESWLYTHAGYPDSIRAGHGLNSAARAICVALAMGFASIKVYGADCAAQVDADVMPALGTPEYDAWLDTLVLYADGRTARSFGADTLMAQGVVDGKRWTTRPDMVISATNMGQLVNMFPGRVELVGDTLPNALRVKDDAFMADMPMLTNRGEIVGFGDGYPVKEAA